MAGGHDSQPPSAKQAQKPFFIYSTGVGTEEKHIHKGTKLIKGATVLS